MSTLGFVGVKPTGLQPPFPSTPNNPIPHGGRRKSKFKPTRVRLEQMSWYALRHALDFKPTRVRLELKLMVHGPGVLATLQTHKGSSGTLTKIRKTELFHLRCRMVLISWELIPRLGNIPMVYGHSFSAVLNSFSFLSAIVQS